MPEKNHFDFCILLSWSHHFDLSGMLGTIIFFLFIFFLIWNINSTVSQRNKRKRADELLFCFMSLVGWRKRRRDLRQQPYPNPVIVQPDTNRQLVKETCSILDQKTKPKNKKKTKNLILEMRNLFWIFLPFIFIQNCLTFYLVADGKCHRHSYSTVCIQPI
jgi:hypothetical protein